ncbi:MAG: IclR family transcriptional regulator [Casimicrobiaceae bacterium]
MTSSLERMLGLLDVFTEANPIWSVDEIAAKFGYTRSTAYRYVRELSDAGLLTPGATARYSLGPRIIQLDRQLRTTDPLLQAMQVLHAELPQWSREQMWLLCRLFQDTVICIGQSGTQGQGVSFSRGYPMPLFRGAASKAILAFLPERHLTRLFLDNPQLVNEAGLGATWHEFKVSLRQIRHQGYAVSVGEVDEGVFGIAAPVFDASRKVIGSLSLVQPASAMDSVHWAAERAGIVAIAQRLSGEVAGEPAGEAAADPIQGIEETASRP